MIPNSVRRQDTLWSFVVFLITSDKRRHTVLSNDQFFLTLSNKLTRRDCVWWTQLRSTQILPSRYFISKCHVSQRMRKFLYTERPCWCNIHDVYPSYQSHTKHSWSFIVWQLVSTSSTGRHQWALGVIDATDIHNNVISLTSIKKTRHSRPIGKKFKNNKQHVCRHPTQNYPNVKYFSESGKTSITPPQ